MPGEPLPEQVPRALIQLQHCHLRHQHLVAVRANVTRTGFHEGSERWHQRT
jgi:hypothetical protein